VASLEDAEPGEERAAGVEDGGQSAEDPSVRVREVSAQDRPEGDQGGGDEDRRRPEPRDAWSRSARHAFAAAFAFFSDLSAFALMKRSVLACASLSTIWTGGDFMR
jgi:hypothetical protein